MRTRTYENEQATVQAIRNAKSFLRDAQPEDTFVLFIAGHGVHDKDDAATYYFLTHETDTRRLSQTAASFELIEDLLRGIAPRQKLFLMDTCESGEANEAGYASQLAVPEGLGVKARGLVLVKQGAQRPAPRTDIAVHRPPHVFERDRYIYNDLLRRTGAVVLSASFGGEPSFERDDLQNGLFTAEVLRVLSDVASDQNADGVISTLELRQLVAQGVAARSRGAQNPTVDRDNIYARFGFEAVTPTAAGR